MKICKVRIQNLNSLRLAVEIDFEVMPLCNTGLFAITGDTGAGKTTILDAITLALYGRIHRNKEVNEVMSYGASESLAEVEFDTGAGRFLSRWTLRRAHNRPDGNFQTAQRQVMEWDPESQQYKIIAERVREAEQAIEEITGLDYDRFTRSVLLAQGDFAAFLQAGERERSDLLERITGTGIYTRLSQAAFSRNKLEGQRLQALQQERESLQVLSPAELELLEQEQAGLQEQIDLLRSELSRQRADLQWLEKKAELEHRLDRALAEMEAVAAGQAAAAVSMEQLARHEQVQRFEAQLQRLDHALTSAVEEESEAGRLGEQLGRLAAELDLARKHADDQLKALNVVRAGLEEKKDLFDQIIQFDASLNEKAAPLEAARRHVQGMLQALEEVRDNQADNSREQQELQAKLSSLGDWLASNQALGGLQDDLPGMEQVARQWSDKQANVDRLGVQLEQIRSEEEILRQKAAEIDAGLSVMTEARLRLEVEFDELAAATYAISRKELLHLLAAEIEQTSNRREGLQQLAHLSEEYQQLLRQMSRYEDEQEELRSQEFMLSKSLMTAMDEMEELDRKIAYRQEVYQQQLLIANYEKDRRRLKEGEPCPLCFSTDHPFRTQEVKPYVDEARQDLDRLQRRREKVGRHYQELLQQHNEVGLRQDQLSGDQRQTLYGGQRELQERLEQYEERIALFAPSVEAQVFSAARADSLLRQLEELQQYLDARRLRHERLKQLHEKLEEEENQLRELREQHRERSAALALVRQRLENVEEQLAGRHQEADSALQALREFFIRYNLTLNDQDPLDLFSQLHRQKAEFGARQEERRQLAERLKLAGQRAQQLLREVVQLEEKLAQGRGEEQRAVEALEALQRQRRELFGDRDPQAERKALEQQIAHFTRAHDGALHSLAGVEKAHDQTQGKIRDHVARAQRARELAAGLSVALEAAIRNAGFDDLDQVRNALLPAEEARALIVRRQSLHQREVEARKAKQDAEEALAFHLAGGAGVDAGADDLRNSIREQEERLGNRQQEAGGIRERLSANAARARLAAALVEKIAAQERECRRWAGLNEVIGMADGKKFRVFAQGLTLSRLVRLANVHLRQLNGRYLIRKRGEEDLGLDIIDTFQADHCRSMHTLSGGESFLVSLALALGLSDLAGQQTNIRSLFIDEGFGTLDEGSLDLAIATLENLQAAGKTIGIISHVKELKERIAVQVQVRKRANGFSNVHIMG